MNHDALTYQIAFSRIKGINRLNAEELLKRVGSEELFFTASESQLAAIMGSRHKFIEEGYRQSLLKEAEAERMFVDNHNVKCLYFTGENYPTRLNDCDDAPLMLYTLGETDLNNAHVISIVGTRHATPYGIDFINHLVEDLGKRLDNVIIVSGLAYGVDIAAHKAALRENVPTIAVFAHGLNTIYPAAHRATAVDIIKKNGMLMTDYTSADKIHKGNFLARNRIVAGIADCVVVVESALKGGAMVTAKIASAYNRDVFAVPGRVSDPYSAGCNALIANQQACLISNAEDLISTMRWTAKPLEGTQAELFIELTEEEQNIIDFITQHPDATVNDIGVNLNISSGSLMAKLIDMEFKDLVTALPGGRYAVTM
jgi:DNA processing protein